MARRSPRPIIFLLPLMFILLLVMFIPAIVGSAEQEHNVTALEHSEGASGALGLMLAGDMILPAIGLLVMLAILIAAFIHLGRAGR